MSLYFFISAALVILFLYMTGICFSSTAEFSTSRYGNVESRYNSRESTPCWAALQPYRCLLIAALPRYYLRDLFDLHSACYFSSNICKSLSTQKGSIGGLSVLSTTMDVYLLTSLDALIFSGAFFAAWCGVLIASGNAGQGRHIWDVSIAAVQRFALVREK